MTLLVVSLFSVGAMAQVLKVTGKVTDAKTGEGLPGVSVIVKGTTTGTATDINGAYSINASKGATLVFSFVGYTPFTATVEGTTLNVKLAEASKTIEEVVVIGYGTVKKSDATGSVQAIGTKDFNKGASVSAEQLIQGKTPGVVITSDGGAPGSSSTVRIRGGSSISASNNPLYVIDGVAVDNSSIAGMSNPLNTINPNDIESINILKDASATAIYGARASNGVIIITTKKGTSSMKVTYSGKMVVNTVAEYAKVYSAEEFTNKVNSYYGDPTLSSYNPKAVALLGTSSTDWQKKIFHTALGSDHNISVGGTLKDFFPYRVSLGYTNEDGTLKTSNFNRTTGAISLTPSFFNKTLNVSLNLKGVYNTNRFANTDAVGAAVGYDPTQPVYSSDAAFIPYGGYYTWLQTNGKPNKIATSNPVALLNQTADNSHVYRSVGNLMFDYKIPYIDGLKANLNLGYDYSKSNGSKVQPANAAFTYNEIGGQQSSGYINNYNELRRTQLLDFYLNYNKEFSNEYLNQIDITGGYSWQHFWKSGNSVSHDQQGVSPVISLPYITENYIVSFFGRANFTILKNFILTGTIRDDGSSRFTGSNKWGLFPSGALAWKVSGMDFMKDIKWLNDVKLRLGYGITGQQDITTNDYPTLGLYAYSKQGALIQMGYNTDGSPNFVTMLRPGGYNNNLKWESAATTNLGLDFGLFSNRITGSIDVYQKKTSNLINTVPIPAGSNFTNQILANVGDMTNKGFEVALSGKIITKQDFTWDVNANLSYNKSEITKLLQNNDPSYAGVPTGSISGGTGNNIQIQSIGYARNTFYVYQQIFDKNGKPIEGAYVDQNGDGVINQADLIHFHQSDPKYAIGLSTILTYKKWDFGAGGRANIGNWVYNNVASGASFQSIYSQSNYLSNQSSFLNDFNFNQVTEKSRLSSYFIQPASFFKLDYVSLGYKFSGIFKSKLNIRLSATAQNVFTITKYKGIDPEYSSGIDNNIYPRPRTYVVNLNLDF
jgi:TonB-linked outer membrane protein, SusC/RagA family